MTVNDLRFMEKRKNINFPKRTKGALVVLSQKKDSEKVEQQTSRWRKSLTKKKKLFNSVIVFLFFLWLGYSIGRALA